MTASAIPGRPVPTPVLQGPESVPEHLSNALQILTGAYVDEHGVRELSAIEYAGICTRLRVAIKQIEDGLA